MSVQPVAQPQRIIVQTERAPPVREPKERWEKIDIDAVLVPAFLIGGFVAVAFYREQIVSFIDDTVDKLGSKELKDLIDKIIHPDVKPLPPINFGGIGTPSGSTLWTSAAWGNGKSRTITSHHQFDPYDKRLDISAGSGRKGVFPGDGTARLSGDQSRFYIYANNYNSAMFLTVSAGNGVDNISLRLRSRHNEGGASNNRFGGYGVTFYFGANEIGAKREDYHNVHTSLGNCKSPVGLGYGRNINLGMSVQDAGNAVNIGAYIDGKRVCTFLDKSPRDYMVNKSLYGQKSYSWIRQNGSGTLTLSNVTIKEIGALSSANIAYTWPSSLPQEQLMQYYNNYYPYPYMRKYDKSNRRMLEQRVTIA